MVKKMTNGSLSAAKVPQANRNLHQSAVQKSATREVSPLLVSSDSVPPGVSVPDFIFLSDKVEALNKLNPRGAAMVTADNVNDVLHFLWAKDLTCTRKFQDFNLADWIVKGDHGLIERWYNEVYCAPYRWRRTEKVYAAIEKVNYDDTVVVLVGKVELDMDSLEGMLRLSGVPPERQVHVVFQDPTLKSKVAKRLKFSGHKCYKKVSLVRSWGDTVGDLLNNANTYKGTKYEQVGSQADVVLCEGQVPQIRHWDIKIHGVVYGRALKGGSNQLNNSMYFERTLWTRGNLWLLPKPNPTSAPKESGKEAPQAASAPKESGKEAPKAEVKVAAFFNTMFAKYARQVTQEANECVMLGGFNLPRFTGYENVHFIVTPADAREKKQHIGVNWETPSALRGALDALYAGKQAAPMIIATNLGSGSWVRGDEARSGLSFFLAAHYKDVAFKTEDEALAKALRDNLATVPSFKKSGITWKLEPAMYLLCDGGTVEKTIVWVLATDGNNIVPDTIKPKVTENWMEMQRKTSTNPSEWNWEERAKQENMPLDFMTKGSDDQFRQTRELCINFGEIVSDPLHAFLRGEAAGPDNKYMMLDILNWDYGRMERVHNYIQWVFPIKDPSQFNRHAPVLTRALAKTVAADSKAMANIQKMFVHFLGFAGLEIDRRSNTVLRIGKSAAFAKRRRVVWGGEHNHNWLRISRILTCLGMLGMVDQQAALFKALEMLWGRGDIPESAKRSFSYWANSAGQGSKYTIPRHAGGGSDAAPAGVQVGPASRKEGEKGAEAPSTEDILAHITADTIDSILTYIYTTGDYFFSNAFKSSKELLAHIYEELQKPRSNDEKKRNLPFQWANIGVRMLNAWYQIEMGKTQLAARTIVAMPGGFPWLEKQPVAVPGSEATMDVLKTITIKKKTAKRRVLSVRGDENDAIVAFFQNRIERSQLNIPITTKKKTLIGGINTDTIDSILTFICKDAGVNVNPHIRGKTPTELKTYIYRNIKRIKYGPPLGKDSKYEYDKLGDMPFKWDDDGPKVLDDWYTQEGITFNFDVLCNGRLCTEGARLGEGGFGAVVAFTTPGPHPVEFALKVELPAPKRKQIPLEVMDGRCSLQAPVAEVTVGDDLKDNIRVWTAKRAEIRGAGKKYVYVMSTQTGNCFYLFYNMFKYIDPPGQAAHADAVYESIVNVYKDLTKQIFCALRENIWIDDIKEDNFLYRRVCTHGIRAMLNDFGYWATLPEGSKNSYLRKDENGEHTYGLHPILESIRKLTVMQTRDGNVDAVGLRFKNKETERHASAKDRLLQYLGGNEESKAAERKDIEENPRVAYYFMHIIDTFKSEVTLTKDGRIRFVRGKPKATTVRATIFVDRTSA